MPRDTQVDLLLLEEVSSKVAKPDDFFKLKVSHPVRVPGGIAVLEGARAVGQVIDAHKAGIFGSPARLTVTVRYLEQGDLRIPMRLHRAAQGADHTTGGMVAGIAIGVFGAFLKGGEIILPVGSVVTARVAKDVVVPIILDPPATAVQVASSPSTAVPPAAAAAVP